MASATSYLQKKLLDHIFGVATYTPPTSRYLALFTSNPTKAGSFSGEVTGGGYARLDITSQIGAADLSTGRSVSTSVINIGPATTDWGTVTYAAVIDESGNMILFSALAEAQTINEGDQFQLTPAQFAAICT